MDNSKSWKEIEEELEKIRRELCIYIQRIMIMKLKTAAILVLGIGVPIAGPSLGIPPSEIRSFLSISLPAMAVTLPVAFYKIYRWTEMKKYLVKRLIETENMQIEEEPAQEGEEE